jgi:hypothetical protein
MSAATKEEMERDIVLNQLFASSPDLCLTIGGQDGGMVTLTRDELIGHVEQLDDFGEKYVKTHMDYMRSFKTGELYDLLEEVESL